MVLICSHSLCEWLSIKVSAIFIRCNAEVFYSHHSKHLWIISPTCSLSLFLPSEDCTAVSNLGWLSHCFSSKNIHLKTAFVQAWAWFYIPSSEQPLVIDLFCHCCLSLRQCNTHSFVVSYLHGEIARIVHGFCCMQPFLRNNNHLLVFLCKSTDSAPSLGKQQGLRSPGFYMLFIVLLTLLK